KRVAVRLAGRDRLGPDDGARPRLVLDNDGLAEIPGHLLRQRAGNHVGAAAGRKWHDDLDDTLGITRRCLVERKRRQHDECCRREQKPSEFDVCPKSHACARPCEKKAASMACPSENVLYVAELLNWRVQKLILKP